MIESFAIKIIFSFALFGFALPEPYPVFHVTAITHRKDAVYPATIVGIPPMEDFYIGGAALPLTPSPSPIGWERVAAGRVRAAPPM